MNNSITDRTTGQVARDTVTLRVEGNPDAHDTVLLLHGFASSPEADYPDDELPARLLERGARVVRARLLGHDVRPPVGTSLGVPEQLAALRGALADAGITPTAVVGYSLGARLAWEFLTTKSVTRIVLGGAAPGEPLASVDLDALESGAAEVDGLTRRIRDIVDGSGWNASGLFAVIRGLRRDGYRPSRPESDARVLLLAGDDDALARPELLAPELAHAVVERLPGDHGSLPHSPRYLDRVCDFVTRMV